MVRCIEVALDLVCAQTGMIRGDENEFYGPDAAPFERR